MTGLYDWRTTDYQAYFSLLVYWSPFINNWLDKNDVKGHPHAQAVVRVCRKLYTRHFDPLKWSVKPETFPHVREMIMLVKRLKGLDRLS